MKQCDQSGCPSEQELRQFAMGLLSAERESAVAKYVDECRACQGFLDSLDRTPEEVSWSEYETHSPFDSDALRRELNGLKKTPSPEVHAKVFTDIQPWLEPGEAIGRFDKFELLECVGRGGMGIVFRARDCRLNRVVALKVLSPSMLADPTAASRFRREAQSAASIDHSAVVAVHSVSELRDLPYLVMEYVEGESLQGYLERVKSPPIAKVIEIAKQCAEALAAAHAAGVVHRDVKPANILLEKNTGRVKLTDFGLARGLEASSLTQTGLLVGTPEYVAPEQVQGKPVDYRADLFSLGCVIYVMCTGKVPFSGPSIMSTLNSVCHGESIPISEIVPAAPDWLSELVEQLLAKEPEQRPASAAAVVQRLELGPAAERPKPIKKKASPLRPSKLLWGLAACVLLAAIGGIGYWAGGGGQAGADDDEAEVEEGEDPVRWQSVVAKNSSELAHWLAEAEEPTEILLMEETYELESVELDERELRFVAAEGLRPVVQFTLHEHDEAGLVLHGCDVEFQGIELETFCPDWESEEFEEGEGDDEPGDHGLHLIVATESRVLAQNCRFLNGTLGCCLELSDSDGEFNRCELLSKATNIEWNQVRENSLRVEGCNVIGTSNFQIASVYTGDLEILQSSFLALQATFLLDAESWSNGGMSVRSERNQFDAERSFLDVWSERDVNLFEQWNGVTNLLPPLLMENEDQESWDGAVALGIVETVSRFEEPTYQLSREQLLEQAGNLEIDAIDLLRVGPDWKLDEVGAR
ncbi:MAG: serine/threonine-protein kinase [Planctomycetota bacterium]